jgi:hypothetical protein
MHCISYSSGILHWSIFLFCHNRKHSRPVACKNNDELNKQSLLVLSLLQINPIQASSYYIYHSM